MRIDQRGDILFSRRDLLSFLVPPATLILAACSPVPENKGTSTPVSKTSSKLPSQATPSPRGDIFKTQPATTPVARETLTPERLAIQTQLAQLNRDLVKYPGNVELLGGKVIELMTGFYRMEMNRLLPALSDQYDTLRVQMFIKPQKEVLEISLKDSGCLKPDVFENIGVYADPLQRVYYVTSQYLLETDFYKDSKAKAPSRNPGYLLADTTLQALHDTACPIIFGKDDVGRQTRGVGLSFLLENPAQNAPGKTCFDRLQDIPNRTVIYDSNLRLFDTLQITPDQLSYPPLIQRLVDIYRGKILPLFPGGYPRVILLQQSSDAFRFYQTIGERLNKQLTPEPDLNIANFLLGRNYAEQVLAAAYQ